MSVAATESPLVTSSCRPVRALTVLVTGASGLLGGALVAALAREGHRVIGAGRSAGSVDGGRWLVGSIEDRAWVGRAVTEVQPDWIVHAAALTDLDACERDPACADALHVGATTRLARTARVHGSRFLYVSTDSVYDGDLPVFHHEAETPRPLNRYAESKLAGERACLAVHPEAIIARVNFVGLHPSRAHGLAAWLIAQLRAGRSLGGFTDVVFNPLLNHDLAGLLVRALETDLPGGCYNFGARDACSKFEFARRVANRLGVDPQLVRPVSLADARLPTPRPRHTAMATGRLSAALGATLPTIDEGLGRLLSR